MRLDGDDRERQMLLIELKWNRGASAVELREVWGGKKKHNPRPSITSCLVFLRVP